MFVCCSRGCSQSNTYACMRALLTKSLNFLWKCELQEYDLQYFISVCHTCLLYEEFHPSNKTVGLVTV